MFVYILNCHGEPLMPCRPCKARLLLKAGKARVVKMIPFTLQLLYGCSGYKQEVSLGIDAGTRHIGVSATTEKRVLFEAGVQPRTDIQELLATRRENRRARRARKTRYRQSRFLNRRKPQGWLAPSVQHRVDVHLKTIKMVHRLLPISNTTIEVAQFDLQKLNNPDIEGKAYQEGAQLGFWNVREYVLWRDAHQCQWCQGTSKDPVLNVHHIESRKTGGDRPANLLTLCETCHDLIHRTHQEKLVKQPSGGSRDASQMGILRWRIYEQAKSLFPHVHLTHGYLTKHARISHGLEKSHLIKCVRRNNRQLHKASTSRGGKRRRNIAPKEVHGFRRFDMVRYQGKVCFVFGRRSSGYFDLRLLDGTKIHASASYKQLTVVQKARAAIIERRGGIPPTSEEAGILPPKS